MIDLGGDVTGNGISKLVFTILSAVAEAERDRIRERIADVKRDQKMRGRFLGGSRPFGWQIAADGSLEPLESERKALLAMRRMQKEGKSLRTIATAMQERGFAISHQGASAGARRRHRVTYGRAFGSGVSPSTCLPIGLAKDLDTAQVGVQSGLGSDGRMTQRPSGRPIRICRATR
jgi:hypothetical protein